MSTSRRSISKSPGPMGADEEGFDRAAYERRRQQVRRAQRSHRERKANYVKALEQEVVSLRNQNSQNIQEYEDEIRMLQGHIISSGMNPPPRQARVIAPSTAEIDPANPSSFTVSKHAGMGQALNLHVPASMNKDSYASHTGSSQKSSEPDGLLSVGSSSQRQLSPAPTQRQSSYGNSLSDQLSPTSLDKIHGINFVLGLEHRCMEHSEITRDEFGTHCHMASHNLLAYAPTNINGSVSWEVPGLTVDSLLEWSTTLQAEGVVTPVQAWYRLKQHPFFSMINESQLQQLRSLLVNEVKCYGYGATIDESTWEFAVQTVFMPGTSG